MHELEQQLAVSWSEATAAGVPLQDMTGVCLCGLSHETTVFKLKLACSGVLSPKGGCASSTLMGGASHLQAWRDREGALLVQQQS